MKTFAEYNQSVWPLAFYPDIGENLVYPTLGLCGEAGELAEKVKKMLRDDNAVLNEERRAAIIKEAGDVLWYLNAVANELGTTLDEIADVNVEKLRDRRARGVVGGSGDNR